MSSKNNFVFVVCGADEHIKTLNFSVKYLRKFSKNNIIVITDKQRNRIEIEHNNVVDISTPAHFNHHQASIYLKTGLYRFIDLSGNYCYLDSDVIALTPKVDEIFNHVYGPVTFAADHCRIDSFSPNAVNCGCFEKRLREQEKLLEEITVLIPEYKNSDPLFYTDQGRNLFRLLYDIRRNPLKRVNMITNYLLAVFFFNEFSNLKERNKIFKYSRRKKGWIDLEGNLITSNLRAFSKEISKNGEFSFNTRKKVWENKNGDDIFTAKCGHLAEMIFQKFSINVSKIDFQHWNGGVFLFDKNSTDFLKTWHQFTMEIFNDSEWKTRDQGTLIATVWKYNLQNQKLLPREFNFIADYYSPQVTFNSNKGFTYDNYKTIIDPKFIHVYHQFGNKDWDIWQGIEKTLEIT